jgi:hypothetical protein
MTGVLDALERERKRLAPTFVFIDPFGFKGVPFTVVARLMQNPRCECLITFMYESINRFLFLAHPDAEIQAHFDELFGSKEWRRVLGESDPAKRRDQIVTFYRQRLLEAAYLHHVRTCEMINRGNRTEYFLYFGTNSLVGLSKMQQAMWRADPERGQVFSDRTDTSQMVLLQPEPELRLLRKLLIAHFRGHRWVRIDEVENFIPQDTPYSEVIHLKRLTLKPMELEEPPTIEVRRPPGVPNRPGDYPAETRIKFL